MDEANSEQDGKPSEEEACRGQALGLPTHQLKRESEPEEEREQRKELTLRKKEDEAIDYAIERTCPGCQSIAEVERGRGEVPHIDQQDAEERNSPQNIERKDSAVKTALLG
ncbi:hypothetical protein D3C72_1825970 [compost metagenome]